MAAYAISSFSVSEILTKGWEILKDNAKEVLVGGFAYGIATNLPSYLVGMAFEAGSGVAGILNLAIQIWSIYLTLGITRYMLAIIRGQHPSLELIFNNTQDFVKYFIINLRYFIVVFGGLLLLVLPGIYFAIKYMYVTVLVADNKADGAEAFKKSAEMTEGNMMNLLVYGVVVAVLVGIGMIALLLPGIIAMIVGGLGSFLIYEYLLKKIK